MDRRIRMGLGGVAALMAGGLLLCSTGCRSTRSEVPAGKPYQTTGSAPDGWLQSGTPSQHGQRDGQPLREPRPWRNGPGRNVSLWRTGGNGLRHAHPRDESRLAHGESIRTAGHLGNGRIGSRRDRAAHKLVAQRPAPSLSGPGQGPGQHVDDSREQRRCRWLLSLI